MNTIIRKPELEQIIGYTERTIRNMENAGTFPRRFKLNPDGRAVGWDMVEVENWIKGRVASRPVDCPASV